MKTFQQLPDTITPLDYMEWRNCGRATARSEERRVGKECDR